MANLANLSFWFGDFTVERGTHHLEGLLTLFPISVSRPDLRLAVRSLDSSESVTMERELTADPETVRELCAEFLHEDTSYEVSAFWDLWRWETAEGPRLEWSRTASGVEFILQGKEYDTGRWEETGHVWMRLGDEHLFTGHAGMLTGGELRPEDAETRAESEFAWALQEPETLREYRRYTRENVRQLYGFLREADKSLPVERHRLWSEGETDFEEVTKTVLAGGTEQ